MSIPYLRYDTILVIISRAEEASRRELEIGGATVRAFDVQATGRLNEDFARNENISDANRWLFVSIFFLRAIWQLEDKVGEVVVVDFDAAAVKDHLWVAGPLDHEVFTLRVKRDDRWVLLDTFADKPISICDKLVGLA